MQRRFRGPPTAVMVIVVAVIQVVGTVFASARQPDHRPLDLLAFALLLLGPAALSLRRRAPGAMLPLAVVAMASYLSLGYAWGPVFLSFALALVLTAASGMRGLAWTVAGLCAVAVVVGSVLGGDEAALIRVFAATSWLGILVLLGEGIRLRSERVAERHRQREAAEQAARDEYRLTLARDIHDVVAHSLSLINVRASVALHLGEKNPAHFRPALEAIKAASKDSLAEIRQLLGVLRDDAPLTPAPPRTIARIPELVDNARRAGLDVRLELNLPAQVHVHAPVQEAAYRIVQEALTNVVRHSGARKAVVVLRSQAAAARAAESLGTPAATATELAGGQLTVTIDDDGAGAAGMPEGNGITGMRERTAALGGRLDLGTVDSGTARGDAGWRVRAVFPLPGTGNGDRP
ncbi:signal transduction histidine kinase [Arthrobacter pascens]|uniref:sensor histidine kinase n=1 Tax=Arthrobacter pascens TaxID=1677 RepID=UPI00278EB11C|nr:histidine kinase [Arthrobacter pascens]MDQ0679559.1 signal transduction histidine kinase [Arthrobacter pascens]